MPIRGTNTRRAFYGASASLGESLRWNASDSAVPPGWTLTRSGTNATYFDSSGVLQTAGANVARFSYNPATLALRGLMVEQAATNLCIRSTKLADAAWTAAGTALTADQSLYLDGTTTMASEVSTLANLAYGAVYLSYEYPTAGITVSANTEYVASIDVKRKQGTNGFRLFWAVSGFTSGVYADFDLTNGVCSTVGTIGTGSSTGTPRIENMGGGIYRCSVSGKLDAATTTGYLIPAITKGYQDTATFTPTAGDGFYVAGAQLELGTAPTSRIVTAAASATRSADVLTAPTSGLLVNGQGFAAMGFEIIGTSAASPAFLSSFTGTEGAPLMVSGGNLVLYDGSAFRTGPAITLTPGTIGAIASTWSGSASQLALNGVTASETGFDGSMDFSAILRIGNHVSGLDAPISMYLNSLRLGNTRALNNNELGALTT